MSGAVNGVDGVRPGAEVLVAGGGHNGLVAAILAAKAGFQVTVVEKEKHVGGAAISTRVFRGRSARLSKYAYLVSLFPQELADRLGLALPLASRTVSSYTPIRRDGVASGLLVERQVGAATEQSFRDLTGGNEHFAAWQQLYGELADFATAAAPFLTGPLASRDQVRDAVVAAAGSRIWDDVVERPIGEMIRERFSDDIVRGVVATDALIGTYTSLDDPSLLANRCFLYHVIGRGTGEWHVPIGGMGAVTEGLRQLAVAAGVTFRNGTTISAVAEDSAGVTVAAVNGRGEELELRADAVLAAVAPAVLDEWRGRPTTRPEGAQLKINMLLDRLPRLASGADPSQVFAGTTHLEEGFDHLERIYRDTSAGILPETLPAEIYCHSLSDPSILDGHRGHTLTLFGLHTPASLYLGEDGAVDPDRTAALVAAALKSVQMHLDEPLEDCLSRDEIGWLCLDVATPWDVEKSVGMPGGHIFHGDLSWPWLGEGAEPGSHGAEVADSSRILLAGSGTVRGGGVSGLGGLAAVDTLLAGR